MFRPNDEIDEEAQESAAHTDETELRRKGVHVLDQKVARDVRFYRRERGFVSNRRVLPLAAVLNSASSYT